MRTRLTTLLCGLSLLCAGCPTPSANLDANMVDASIAETSDPDVLDAAPIDPPGDPLPPVQLEDLELRAKSNGGFELSVGGRVLLASNYGPVAAQTWQENVEFDLGFWRFRRSAQQEARPDRGATAMVANGAIELRVQSNNGTSALLRFRRSTRDEVEIRASTQGFSQSKGMALRFRCAAENHFLGFGEQFNDVDHRGRSFSLFVSEQGLGRDPRRQSFVSGNHETTYFPVPFFLDPRGFGVALETDARTLVDLCAARSDEYVLAPEQSEELTMHLYTGPTVADVMRVWTGGLQGRSSEPPAWAVDGTWIGIQGGPAAVRAAYQRARTANVPVTVMWAQDWVGRKDLGLGNIDIRYHWTADTMWYPDLPGLITELRSTGAHFLGYFNPFVVREEDQFAEGERMGFLPRNARGATYTFALPHGDASMVDLSNPAAMRWFQGFATRALDLGMDGWMQDYGEWFPTDAVLSSNRDARRFHNRYPVEWHRAAREALMQRRPDGNWVMFSRSGWLGDAHVAQIVWAGDQEASFSEHDGLPTVIPALVSLGMVGIGFVTHDIGGYFGGPSTKELYLRWIELGAFTPVMRTHEGLRRDENWNWDKDAETLAFFSRFARIHALLGPRFRELGQQHRATGMPILRAMGLQFPDDPRTYGLRDEYMIGDDMLVAPVVNAGQTSRRVYFPRGTWYSVWNPTQQFEGPMEREVPAPIGSPPVFTRMPRTDLQMVR